jgi:translation initiation factor 2 beta subunit (eIF-2beta)/eIF-5
MDTRCPICHSLSVMLERHIDSVCVYVMRCQQCGAKFCVDSPEARKPTK